MGYQVTLEFSVTQHIRDIELMKRLSLFFCCGYLIADGPTKVQFRIRNIKELEQHLFPLLDEFPLQTQKALDAVGMREAHALVLSKAHLTLEGLEKIRQIKSKMNRARMEAYKV
uniref:Homing endonuclease LAGLIDADG domain-containing protein n=1 Tax=Microbotryum cf. violaceum BFL-2013 TaxID=1288119 RepID=M1GLX8_9BASI|nr:hypothetical protein H888_mgp12 [Microbotryum cf. violaceum BFL-2013]AGE14647.1 hypothetical protein [Microbotryum cf. violaceum BFL-2013]